MTAQIPADRNGALRVAAALVGVAVVLGGVALGIFTSGRR